ncbi:O-antigen ligase family protein [Fredinandcohnia onubensis]|uniref:O-antigen ligase family protein n=1 Tax=Fredinandcohnia onubensis TaxID=1571209 RepID=UPI000C0BF778|nr:O-antigen ligase family protein [Fredinandcohnia onubensis]
MNIRDNTKVNFFKSIFLLFIILQPILDLATSLSIMVFKAEFTAGVLIRFAMIAIGAIYIFFFSKSTDKKFSIIYLVILGVYLALNIANNLMVKSPFSFSQEVKYIIKTVYFVVIFLSYYFVFKELSKESNWENTIQKLITYAMSIVGVSMVIAAITNTQLSSYTYNKTGHKGWFFAGNELGAILAICFPIVVLFAIKNTKSLRNSYYWIPSIILIYSLMAVGTKVGFGAVLITLCISIVMLVFNLIRKSKSPIPKVNLFINLIVLVGFIVYIPFSPIAENTQIHLSLLDTPDKSTEEGIDSEENPEGNGTSHKPKQNLNEQQIENLVLSGRDQFLTQQKEYFEEAPLTQKLVGMGYGGNYEEKPKLIEMDFHDIFFSFGIIGFIIYLLPLILIAGLLLYKFLLNIKQEFTIDNVLIGSGILLGLGIALTAGHVLTAPAVSIYLAILIAYLYIRIVKKSYNN